VGSNGTSATSIAAVRMDCVGRAVDFPAAVRPTLIFCIHVLCDLRAQGWLFRLDAKRISALPPGTVGMSAADSKARVRAAHLIERDAQLSQRSVRRFIRDMERRRLYVGAWHSIFSLMRDGRALAQDLRYAAALPHGAPRNAALRTAIDPYVQVVSPEARCEYTGLLLADVWRYFRHTWTTTYQSTPGRKMFFLVRDRAAPNHPVVGIGALGSAIVQLSVRDEWIGWTARQFVATLRAEPSRKWARWLHETVAELLEGIRIDDFLTEGLCTRRELAAPTTDVIERLTAFAVAERRVHRLYPDRRRHKRPSITGGHTDWGAQSDTHLFRSKRAAALAELLEARRRLRVAGFSAPTTDALRQALTDPHAVRAILAVLRRAKAAHVGVDMMDITVCGAIAPYNQILGGKLVSLLMASPDIVAAYSERYRTASSIIASSMAGRAVRRPPRLVLLGTTSLYSTGASQYNRIRVPADGVGGESGNQLAFIQLGETAGYGSYHFSQATMEAIDPMLRRLQRGRPVNSIFGEGVNPKLRKVRSALDVAGLPSDQLLQHGSPRLVYAIPLASNMRDVLLGQSRRPKYLLPPDASPRLVDYWRERWLAKRIDVDGILDAVAAESLAYPVRHRARVVLPDDPEEAGPLFVQ
jgi:hypothetical protein